MGQYFRTFNLDKKQFIHPHKLGDGLKLMEQCGWSPGGTNDALHLLLAANVDRLDNESGLLGSWAGDRIAVIGDYSEADEVPGCNAEEVYRDESYEDITERLIPDLESAFECLYIGTGWVDRVSIWKAIKDVSSSHGYGDRFFNIKGKNYRSSQIRAALSQHIQANGKIKEPLSIEELEIDAVAV